MACTLSSLFISATGFPTRRTLCSMSCSSSSLTLWVISGVSFSGAATPTKLWMTSSMAFMAEMS